MQTLSYPTETVLSNEISRNRIVLRQSQKTIWTATLCCTSRDVSRSQMPIAIGGACNAARCSSPPPFLLGNSWRGTLSSECILFHPAARRDGGHGGRPPAARPDRSLGGAQGPGQVRLFRSPRPGAWVRRACED